MTPDTRATLDRLLVSQIKQAHQALAMAEHHKVPIRVTKCKARLDNLEAAADELESL